MVSTKLLRQTEFRNSSSVSIRRSIKSLRSLEILQVSLLRDFFARKFADMTITALLTMCHMCEEVFALLSHILTID